MKPLPAGTTVVQDDRLVKRWSLPGEHRLVSQGKRVRRATERALGREVIRAYVERGTVAAVIAIRRGNNLFGLADAMRLLDEHRYSITPSTHLSLV